MISRLSYFVCHRLFPAVSFTLAMEEHVTRAVAVMCCVQSPAAGSGGARRNISALALPRTQFISPLTTSAWVKVVRRRSQYLCAVVTAFFVASGCLGFRETQHERDRNEHPASARYYCREIVKVSFVRHHDFRRFGWSAPSY